MAGQLTRWSPALAAPGLHLTRGRTAIHRPDTVWNDTFNVPTNRVHLTATRGRGRSAGGGGKSVIFSPSRLTRMACGPSSAGRRGVPDISMSGACNGAADMYQSFAGQPAGWYPTCGTSEATPEFAGIVALADQVAGLLARP